MTAYKNGVKGTIATQVGVVQFKNMVLGDNGAGPKAHLTNGKDTGGQVRACIRAYSRCLSAPVPGVSHHANTCWSTARFSGR